MTGQRVIVVNNDGIVVDYKDGGGNLVLFSILFNVQGKDHSRNRGDFSAEGLPVQGMK